MDIPEISKEQIKSILDFKPDIEQEVTTQMVANLNEPHEIFTMERVSDFLAQFDVTGFNLLFDYQQWLEEEAKTAGSDVLVNIDYLQQADMDTLRKLMTAHVRRERFVSGHLSMLFRTKYITHFLNRLEALYEQI